MVAYERNPQSAMPLPTISDTMRVSVEGLLGNGHRFANVLHYRKSGALSYPAAIAILDPILVDHLSTNNGAGIGWNQFATTAASIQQIRYTPLDGSSATTVLGHVIPGTTVGDSLPGGVALVVTLRTGLRGRSFRGRVYQAPFNEGVNTAGGVPGAASVTAVLVQWQQHLTALLATGVSLVVASYKLAVATDVASISVDGVWDSQRRRNHP
jgi:hypothetical protein